MTFRLGTTKIFVGNIRDGTTSESLRELFECYGRVTEADVLSGFGFVVSVLGHGSVVMMLVS